MAVTRVEHESWLSRLMSSVVGVLVGLVLFVAAFPLLFWGEGRAVKRAADLDAGAAAVVSVTGDSVDPSLDGSLVHLSGDAVSGETLTDPLIGQSVAGAIRLRRVVEMYQWVEHAESTKKKNLGGSTTTVTTYTYDKQWSEQPINSSKFEETGHPNPPMPARGETLDAKQVELGARSLSPGLVGAIDAFEPLAPAPALAAKHPGLAGARATVSGDAYYFGRSPGTPAVGDVRVRLSAVTSPTRVSIVAAQRGSSFTSWKTPDARTLEPRLELGERSADEMFAEMTAENTTMTWLIRLGGFVMMFAGVFMVLRPLVVVADVVPLIGSLIEGGALLISFAVALPLTLMTIAAGWFAYRPLLSVGLGGLGLLIFVAGVRAKRKG